MTSAGITVYNDDNKLTVNQTYKNLVLKRKIKLIDLKTVEIVRRDVPVLDLAKDEILVAVGGMTSNNNMLIIQDYDYDAKRIEFRGVEYSEDGDTDDEILDIEDFKNTYPDVYAYVFGLDTSTPVQSGVGLQVFNSVGGCVFDSTKKYMSVRHFGPTGYTLPSATNKYAICQIGSDIAYTETKGEFGGSITEVSFPAIVNGKVQVRTLSMYYATGFPGSGDSYHYDAFNYMILDVTNY